MITYSQCGYDIRHCQQKHLDEYNITRPQDFEALRKRTRDRCIHLFVCIILFLAVVNLTVQNTIFKEVGSFRQFSNDLNLVQKLYKG